MFKMNDMDQKIQLNDEHWNIIFFLFNIEGNTGL